MKIGIVTEYYYPHLGGITEHVYNFAIELKKMGHTPRIITSKIRNTEFADIPLKDDLILVGRSYIIYSNNSMARVTLGFNLGKKLKDIFEREKFDVVHLHSPITPTLPILSIKYSNAKILVGTLHTHFEKSYSLILFKKYAQKLLNKLDGIISVSEIGAESLRNYLELKSVIIPNGIDLKTFNEKETTSLCPEARMYKGSRNIFFIGRFDPRNKLELLIKAFPIVKSYVPDAKLIIAGYGIFESNYKKMVTKEFKNDIIFIGKLDKTRVDFYSVADVVCYPTDMSSFGIVLLEAMACGKPLVVPDIRAFRDIINNGENGILVKPGSVHSLAEGIIRILTDNALRKKIGENAKKSVRRYDWERVTRDILAFYDDLLKRKNAC